MRITNWLGQLRFRNTSPRSRVRHGRRHRTRFGPLAFIEPLESRTLLSGLAIASFDLLNDTSTPGDYVTIDGRVTGTVTSDYGVAGLTVEIDFDGNGTPDDSTGTDNDGIFIYDPASQIAYGQVTLAARAVEYDPQWMTEVYSAWVSLTFTLHNEAAQVVSFELLNNVGSSGFPKTIDGLVTGTVANPDGGESGLNVEFDYDGDGVVDDYTLTDTEGTFTHDVGVMVGYGDHTIYARSTETDGRGSVYGDWAELSFRYIAPPMITSFTVHHISGYHWRLEGTVDYENPYALSIEFGGVVDGETIVEPDGSFWITTEVFDSGTVTVKATDQFGRWDMAYEYITNP